MSTRWSTDRVMALAPDASSRQAAAKLAGQAPWSGTGAAGDVVWGLCAGSGTDPYQAIADLSGPAFKCSCPSRKFPCKHALALLLDWANGLVPEAARPSDFAGSWIASRTVRAAATAGPPAGGDRQAAARRAAQRSARVAAGLAELDMWLLDQVRAGLSRSGGGYRQVETIAARMVDAQAPGVAAALRGLAGIPASGPGWPGRLLGEYARLHLLVLAHDQLDMLPADLAAVVRSHVGYPVARDDVLAAPAVRDRWLVLASRDLPDGAVPARRIWLRGQRTARFALLLIFDPRGAFSANLDATLVPGTAVEADLHYYPGRPALRAVMATRHDQPEPASRPEPASQPEPTSPPEPVSRPEPAGNIAQLLSGWAGALAEDPWLTSWPALLSGIPVLADDGWQFTDSSGRAVPLLTGGIDVWPLAAISGGGRVTVAGEWGVAGLRPLTAWHGDMAVRL
jgi:SWIM zinc finger